MRPSQRGREPAAAPLTAPAAADRPRRTAVAPQRSSRAPVVVGAFALAAAGALAVLQPWEDRDPPPPVVAAGPDSAALDSIARQSEADSVERVRRQQTMIQAAVDSVRTADSLARERERLAQAPADTFGPGTFPAGGVLPPDDVYELSAVERQPQLRNLGDVRRYLERNYPPVLRDSRVEGQVMVSFVIDEDGRPEAGTLVVTSSAHPGFNDPALSAAERMRFRPAQVGGRDVRVRVTLPIQFQTSG